MVKHITLTIFTPAYNRADLLPRLYESLCRQTCKDFMWSIIDDGSTDNTSELIKGFMKKRNGFTIEYYHKENGGLHTAYNEAISHLKTPLAYCVDSDDWVPDDAVELIVNFWQKNGSEKYAGIIGLDYIEGKGAIGGKFPENCKTVNLCEVSAGTSSIKAADRANVVRSDLYKQVAPMRIFPGEKNFNPHYMHMQISGQYDFLLLNKILKIVEYQQGGMTDSMYAQYENSPNSFAEIRKFALSLPGMSTKNRMRQSIHLTSSYLLAHKPFAAIVDNPYKLLAIGSFVPGCALSALIKWKTRKK